MFNNVKQLEEDLNSHFIRKEFADVDKLFLVDLSDVHIGSKSFDGESLKNTLELIKNTPNFYIILGGDTINHANKGSKSSQFEDDMTPKEQIIGQVKGDKVIKPGAVQFFEPVRDRILCKVDGNHDATRAKEYNDITPTEWLCSLLKIPYMRELALLSLQVGKHNYTAFIHHISGSTGKKINLNKLQELGEQFRADIIFGEHTHRRQYGSEIYVDFDSKTHKPVIREQYFVNANSFQGWGGYAKEKGYRINKTGANIVELGGVGNRRYIRVYQSIEDFIELNSIR